MEPPAVTKERAIGRLWEIAATPPEKTRGTLRGQIRACKLLYRAFAYKPALKMLSELANIDAARTKGVRRDQESAARLLKMFVSSVKIDKSQAVQ